jgi:hypothetical protein
LNAVAANVPWLIGGSADLSPSTKTRLTTDGAGDFSAENPAGRNLHFGSVSTPWPRSSMAVAVEDPAVRLGLSDLQ